MNKVITERNGCFSARSPGSAISGDRVVPTVPRVYARWADCPDGPFGGGLPCRCRGACMPRLSPSEAAADRKLVQGLNEGDEVALGALYDEYGERLYDYALSMTGDEKTAAGIVHDTFIDA